MTAPSPSHPSSVRQRNATSTSSACPSESTKKWVLSPRYASTCSTLSPIYDLQLSTFMQKNTKTYTRILKHNICRLHHTCAPCPPLSGSREKEKKTPASSKTQTGSEVRRRLLSPGGPPFTLLHSLSRAPHRRHSIVMCICKEAVPPLHREVPLTTGLHATTSAQPSSPSPFPSATCESMGKEAEPLHASTRRHRRQMGGQDVLVFGKQWGERGRQEKRKSQHKGSNARASSYRLHHSEEAKESRTDTPLIPQKGKKKREKHACKHMATADTIDINI